MAHSAQRWVSRLLFATCVSLLLGGLPMAANAEGLRLYVAPDGNDEWSGAKPKAKGGDGPLATLRGARNRIRALRATGSPVAGGVIVEVASGVYEIDSPLELAAADSGTQRAPVIFRARKGARVRLLGGRLLSGFQRVTDRQALEQLDEPAREHVLQTDLRAQGVTDYGAAKGGGLELFFNDESMTIARWPNEGFVKIVGLVGGDPVDVRGTKGDRIGKFHYDGDRPQRWVKEKDLWVHGYWFWDWSDQRHSVESIDTQKRIISVQPPYHGYGYRVGQWFYAYNALSELDRPGEWCLDRETGILYFWPPGLIDKAELMVTLQPTLVTMKDTSHVILEGFTLEGCRGAAVSVGGGTGVRIAGCTIRNVGGWAVSISGGAANGVIGCDIYGTGDGGIVLSGGDRKTLTPAGHFAENNHIHHYSRVNRISRPGIRLSGVGNRALHNLIHNAPHQAMSFGGNEHLIEFNEIHSVCYESNDAGAIYAGRDWTQRGTVIRHNYFHHISGREGRGCVGVYLDDAFSGTSTYGNVFYKVTRAAMTGGGRDNIVENNIFVDCAPAVHIDDRGMGWAKSYIAKGGGWHMYEKLAAVSYDQPPYSERYPKLARILDEGPAEPRGNSVVRNIIVRGTPFAIRCSREHNTIEDNLVDEDPRFVNEKALNFRLRDDSPALKLGFEPIPIEKIGLYRDAARASWPVEHSVRLMPEPPKPKPVRTGPPPLLKVRPATPAPEIDGRLSEGEWSGEPVTIEQGIRGEKVGPPSRAWVAYDDDALLVAFENQVDASKPLKTGSAWGQDDAVEIALRDVSGDTDAPILVLRGFASGHFESSDEAGASARDARRAARNVQYATEVAGPGKWSCEWRIPFESLRIDRSKHPKLAFNLSVRKTAGSTWLMWQGTGGYTWAVDKAGFVELTR